METYPNIRGGAVIAQFPYSCELSYRTTAAEGDVGQKYTWANRATPLRRWTLTYSVLTEVEAATLLDFYSNVGGSSGVFSFADPRTGETVPKCRFDMPAFSIEYVAPGHYRTTITIQECK